MKDESLYLGLSVNESEELLPRLKLEHFLMLNGLKVQHRLH